MDKGALLDRLGLAGEDRLVLAKVLDKAGQAESRNIPAATDFLSPQQRATRGRSGRFSCSSRTGWSRRTPKAPSGASGPPFGRTKNRLTGISWAVSWGWVLSGRK